MLKKLIVGFILLVAGIALVHMYTSETAEVVQQNQQVLAALSTRPADLQHLKRPVVRAACTKHSDWDIDTCQTMDAKKLMLGMNAEQVRLAWGKPNRINVTTTADRQHEQWIYGSASPRSYIYLDDGIVRTMQTSPSQ